MRWTPTPRDEETFHRKKSKKREERNATQCNATEEGRKKKEQKRKKITACPGVPPCLPFDLFRCILYPTHKPYVFPCSTWLQIKKVSFGGWFDVGPLGGRGDGSSAIRSPVGVRRGTGD